MGWVSGDAGALLDLSLSSLSSLPRVTLDRDGTLRRDGARLRQHLADHRTRVIELRGGRARTCSVDGSTRLVLRAPKAGDAEHLVLYLGRDETGTPYLAVIPDDPTATGRPQRPTGWSTLREAGADLDDLQAGAFTTAVALANWHTRHRFCPRCGRATVPDQGGWVRRCVADGSEHYPRTDPAVIVAVLDDRDRILLARGVQWPQGRLSVLAGFVEAGESLEAAVAREVAEEVGVRVTRLSYRGNQPWPFPASLMVGFTARAGSTELRLDPEEIAEAAWFTRDELAGATGTGAVLLSPRLSIARRLIEDWYGGPLQLPEEASGPFRGADPS